MSEDMAIHDAEAALKQLFDRYYARLVYFAAQVVGCKETAEDVVQEAFIKYWNQRDTVAPQEQAIKSYLYASVKHASLNLARHQQVKDSYVAAMRDQKTMEESLEKALLQAEVLAQLHQALSTLPAHCQQISRMCYLEGMKNQEVAQELGISVNTVKTQKQRALQLLRLRLKPELFMLLLLLTQ
ncbi:RNA polymerase sigma-70 factor [Pontibacter mangrovi]|uniref:RNA polymerase sigma-70 factor n=1 Tax=Pontibacter mangrovi TaxID=2589816 RepID=A0A501VTH0_9BACT|nr:RNA polymerase sigma-70 factor [Pontibacter mangrovi]TPE41033.1 RNA polymerase sigma-70 factor [Pontibacter mangrovi]